MARAPALQAGGRGFEPHILHRGRAEALRGSLTGWESESRHKDKETHERTRRSDAPSDKREREASEGVRRMPWLPEATKDAAGRESLRGGANGLRSAGVRMGQPAVRRHGIPLEGRRTRRTETSQ